MDQEVTRDFSPEKASPQIKFMRSRTFIRKFGISVILLSFWVYFWFPGFFYFNDTSNQKVAINSLEFKSPCGSHLNLNDHTLYKDVNLTVEMKTQKRTEWQFFLESIPNRFSYSSMNYRQEKGIIYAATGKTLARVLLSIRMIRKLQCSLPVQIWHLDGEFSENELDTINSQDNVVAKEITSHLELFPELQKLGKIKKSYREGRNYHIKSLIILLSSFEEVLYLDSDNFPVLNPLRLFNTREYLETGSIFWPDFWKFPENDPMWEIMGLECNDEYEQESGQLVINKAKSFTALLLSMFFQINHDFYFQLILGDKDTFRLSWKVTNTPYHMVQYPAAIGGRIRVQAKTFKTKFCGYTMLQFTPSGKLMFVHGNGIKYAHSIERGITFETVQYLVPLVNTSYTMYPTVKAFFGGAQNIFSSDEELSSEMGCNEFVMKLIKYTAPGLSNYELVTVPFDKFQNGKYSWVDKAYFDLDGPGGAKNAFCGGGKVRGGTCEDEKECCSNSGWCGLSNDHCSLGCRGGPCVQPPNAFCGNGNTGNFTCENEIDCCSNSGWCSPGPIHCSKSVCIGGPCAR